MVYEFLGLLVESYATWLLLQRLVDASKDSDIPKNVPFAFAINNRKIRSLSPSSRASRTLWYAARSEELGESLRVARRTDFKTSSMERVPMSHNVAHYSQWSWRRPSWFWMRPQRHV